jgi:thiol-disulfide isomerase/thioredoxin
MSRSQQTDRRPAAGQGGPRPALVVAAVVAVLVVVALVVALVAGGGDDGETAQTGGSTPATQGSGSPSSTAGSGAASGAVTVDGDGLATLQDGGIDEDEARGSTIPTITGTDLDGNALTIGPDGRAKMIVVLAHWCPHCQAEVPVLVDWLAGGGLPDGMDLVGVATANSPNRPNYPAKDWLAREGWDAPTLLDDTDQNAAFALGTSAYPFMVVTDADGRVVARTSGELRPADLDDLVSLAE